MRICITLLLLLLFPKVYAESLIVGLEKADNRPFEYVDDAKNLTGFHVELVRRITQQLGWEVTFIPLPWKRAILSLEKGDIDAVTYVAKNAEREKFAYFLEDNLLHVNGATLYIKKTKENDIKYTPPIEDFVRKWATGFPAGYYMGERIKRLLESDAPIHKPTLNQAQLFTMLIRNRYDVVFGSISALELKTSEIAQLKSQIQPLENARFVDTLMYIAFSKKQPITKAQAFSKAYNEFKQQPAYLALAQQFEVTSLLPLRY